MYNVTRAISLSKYKYIQHEDSHKFPRIITVWSYKCVKSTIFFLFDSLGTLTFVTIGQESSKSVYFPAFLVNAFYFLSKAVSHLLQTAKVLKILSLSTETAMS